MKWSNVINGAVSWAIFVVGIFAAVLIYKYVSAGL